ncbi:MAG: uroporphyrinogen-III synthase [Rhizobiaceae bacterium]|jgi:uroporphyrinogen-III synthase
MRRRVLITRPEPGASRTAGKLAALRCEPLLLPLTEIRPLPADLPTDFVVDAVAVSSANALRHAGPALLRQLGGLPVFAVGPRTAEAAADAGMASVTIGPGDGDGLALLMTRRIPSGSRVAYLCGRRRTGGFETALKAAGVAVLPVETYDTAACSYSDEALKAAVGAGGVDIVLLYSRAAAEELSVLTDRSVVTPSLAQSTFICISPRVAEPIIPFGRGRVRIAATPDEGAMLMLLGR